MNSPTPDVVLFWQGKREDEDHAGGSKAVGIEDNQTVGAFKVRT